MKRGEIFYANLGKGNKTSVQSGVRPVLIIQNDIGNKHSSTVIVAPLTSKIKKVELPTHIILTKDKNNGLEFNSVVLLEQIQTISIKSIYYKIGEICNNDLININQGLKISLGINT